MKFIDKFYRLTILQKDLPSAAIVMKSCAEDRENRSKS